MSQPNFAIEPLFAEPYLRANIGHAISDEQRRYIMDLKMVRNQTNLISENLYIFEEPELASIKEAVHEVLGIYARDVLGITQTIYVTQSWSLINEPNVGMHGHSHSNSFVSGSLYYTRLPDPPSNMIFDRHRSYQQLELTPDFDKRSIYNTPVNVVTPRENEVILFSSSLQHFVETNRSSEPRYSIAFNTFVKGKFGNYRDVSELTL